MAASPDRGRRGGWRAEHEGQTPAARRRKASSLHCWPTSTFIRWMRESTINAGKSRRMVRYADNLVILCRRGDGVGRKELISSPIGSGNGCGATTETPRRNTRAGQGALRRLRHISTAGTHGLNRSIPINGTRKAGCGKIPRRQDLMKGGKQTVTRPRASQSVASRLLYTPFLTRLAASAKITFLDKKRPSPRGLKG
jgi:hypothetical protein